MKPFSRLIFVYKAISELGFQPAALDALYRFGLMSGHYRRMTERITRTVDQHPPSTNLRPVFNFPTREQLMAVIKQDGLQTLIEEANEIVSGKVRLFGGNAVELNLTVPGKLEQWVDYETGNAKIPYSQIPGLAIADIKFIWEPARFGWAFTLGRAWLLDGDEKYAEAFWRYFKIFTDANPPYLGPHWMNGQEVALRMMAFVWAAQVFDSVCVSTPERKASLTASIAAHAARIPATLIYARAQQNNHLLSEAAGLLTAGLALSDHADASRWRAQGWHWLNAGLQSQIDSYGEYAQHSTNYHRLMLELVLWSNALAAKFELRWPRQTLEAVRRSVHWLLSLLDSESSQTPNLGANDGAYIFPLTISPFSDYRPVLHAAARALLDYDLPRGPWDELALWFGVLKSSSRNVVLPRYLGDQLYGKNSWGSLRTAQYTTRPSHADQLHFDLWWRGLNIAQDAGTYLYNADSPWDNSLTKTLVHNTVAVNGRDQMTRAGRFLYLDWKNAYRVSLPAEDPAELQRVRGRYRGRGYRHTRIVSVGEDDRWLVEDKILPLRMPWEKKPLTCRLQWLLPDWKWELVNDESKLIIRLQSPYGWVKLEITPGTPIVKNGSQISLFRGGEMLHGSSASDPVRGWVSPTYGVKTPALSLAVETESMDEIKFATEFSFPK